MFTASRNQLPNNIHKLLNVYEYVYTTTKVYHFTYAHINFISMFLSVKGVKLRSSLDNSPICYHSIHVLQQQ